LAVDDVMNIVYQLAEKFELFSIRRMDETFVFVCSINSTINIELTVPANDLVLLKIGLSILLMLYQDPSLVIDSDKFKNNICEVFIFPYNVIKKEDSANKRKYPFKGMVQSALVSLDNNDIPVAVVISPDFEVNADMVVDAGNKALLYLMVSVIGKIKEVFYDKKIMHSSRERKVIMNKVGYLLDYLASDFEANPKELCVDVSQLD
jgi:hypothetical protein